MTVEAQGFSWGEEMMSSQFKTMEATFYNDAREVLKQCLESLSAERQMVFRMMYARDRGRRSVADAEALPIESVIAEVPADRLDWAMQQVQTSLGASLKETP